MLSNESDTEEQRVFHDNWRFLEELAKAGKCTDVQHQQANKIIKKSREMIKAFVKRKNIVEVEGRLLESELSFLEEKIYASPPVDIFILCYKSSYVDPIAKSIEHIKTRLRLLKWCGGVDMVTSLVLEKILLLMERDVANLEKTGDQGSRADKEKLDQLFGEAKAVLEKMKMRLVGGATEMLGG